MSVFNVLNKINVNEHTEKKGRLTYLSWAWAWETFKKAYPEAIYTIKMDDKKRCWFGDDTTGYMVYTTVKVGDLEHSMWLPVMDHRNKSILKPTTFEINKTLMRCLTKNLAMFGLGLYIYAGEDMPEAVIAQPKKANIADFAEEKKALENCKDLVELQKVFTKDISPDSRKVLVAVKDQMKTKLIKEAKNDN